MFFEDRNAPKHELDFFYLCCSWAVIKCVTRVTLLKGGDLLLSKEIPTGLRQGSNPRRLRQLRLAIKSHLLN